MNYERVEIQTKDLLDLVHWARRYCSGRMTGAPIDFNVLYRNLLDSHPEIMESEQSDEHVIPTWPYAEEK